MGQLSAWSQVSVDSLQTSAVQVMLSLQLGAMPGLQPRLMSQVSAPLHHWPSSQAVFCGAKTQESVVSLQESAVQGMASSQVGAVPGWQPRTESQVSRPLQ